MKRLAALVVCLAGLLFSCHLLVSPPVSRIMSISDQEAPGVYDILVMRENGYSFGNLTESILPSVACLDWSPDGKKIAFGYMADNRMFLMNGDGTDRESLTDAAEAHYNPCWSPDSRKLALLRGGDLDYIDLSDRGNPVWRGK